MSLQFATMCMESGVDAEQMFASISDRDSLEFYKKYLQTVIIKLKDKQDLFNIERQERKNTFVMTAETDLWLVTPQLEIELIEDDLGWYSVSNPEDIVFLRDNEIGLDEEISFGVGKAMRRRLDDSNFKVDGNTYKFKFEEMEQGFFKYCDKKIGVTPLSASIPDNPVLYKNGTQVKAELISSIPRMTFRITGYWDSDTVSIDGIDHKCRIVNDFVVDKSAVRYGPGYLIVSKTRPGYELVENITKKVLKEVQLSELDSDDVDFRSFGLQRSGTTIHSFGNDVPEEFTAYWTRCPLCVFSFHTDTSSNKIQYRILPKDESKEDLRLYDGSRDPRMAIFEDNAMLYVPDLRPDAKPNKGRRVYLVDRDRDSFTIGLSFRENGKAENVDSETLQLKFDTADIVNQLEAIKFLKRTPYTQSIGLIKLFSQKTDNEWDNFEIEDALPAGSWRVLTNTEYEGTEEQRRFVLKSLATPDYAILDGPPGTGKTTAIRELIIQLIFAGKKVLMASSTNAAINNLIERLVGIDCVDNPDLKEKLHLLRLGIKEKAEEMGEYSMEELQSQYSEKYGLSQSEAKKVLLESSNLICGTISRVNRDLIRGPYSPDKVFEYKMTDGGPIFDYMIMDESSKTTLQEFIIPALISKRWILAGDVRQLSPFTERAAVVDNVHDLTEKVRYKKDESFEEYSFPNNHKEALLWLFYGNKWVRAIRGQNEASPGFSKPIAIFVPPGVASYIEREISLSYTDENTSQRFCSFYCIENRACFYQYSQIYSSDLLFINEKLKNDHSLLPLDVLIVGEDYKKSPEFFMYRAINRDSPNLKEDVDKLISKDKNQSWDEEVAWRLDRIYWLRNTNDNPAAWKRENEIYDIFPFEFFGKNKRIPMRNQLFRILDAIYPSILEMMTGSISRSNNRMKKHLKTDISSTGLLSDDVLEKRRESLIYQHRMHPQISRTPAELFYSDLKPGLMNGSNTQSDSWGYRVCGKDQHVQWLDCKNIDYKNTERKNNNIAEGKIICDELIKFIDWAKDHRRDEGPYEVILLTFYVAQKRLLSKMVTKRLFKREEEKSFISYDNVNIKINTVDYIQGQEADVVLLSMVRNSNIGFMDTPNRLNVGITRARHNMVFVGNYEFFANNRVSSELKQIAKNAMGATR